MTMTATDTIHYPGHFCGEVLGPTSTRGDLFVLDHDDDLIDALVSLNRLGELEEDWDSYGSVPPSLDLIAVAESLLVWIDRHLAPFLAPPHITAVSGGGVQFAWQHGSRELEIELGPLDEGLSIEYLRSSHGEPINEDTIEPVVDLLDHLGWIVGG